MAATATRIDREILQHEKEFWEASKGDAARLGKLCADNFTFIMAEGITNFSRKEFVDMITAGDYKLQSFEIEEGKAVIRELGPAAAVVAYPAKSQFELRGKNQKTRAFYSSVWTRQGNDWKCAVVSESVAEPAK